MKRYFCTYFDQNFIYQGLALYQSLVEHSQDFTLWVLCFDDVTHQLLSNLNLPSLRPIALADFEAAYPELVAVKPDRSKVEYYWTSTPLLPSYILKLEPQIDLIAYLDADLFFYSDLDPIYAEWGNGSIYLIPHRFGSQHRVDGEAGGGIYNVGFVGFRRDKTGIACLEYWGQKTIEWCYNRIEAGLLGDQKYLDDWPKRFSGVVVSQNHGIGAGGWNIFNYRVLQRDNQIYLDDSLLIMLHLNFVHLLSSRFFMATPRWSLRPVYQPYAASLRWAIRQVRQVSPDFKPQYASISVWTWLGRLVRGGLVVM